MKTVLNITASAIVYLMMIGAVAIMLVVAIPMWAMDRCAK